MIWAKYSLVEALDPLGVFMSPGALGSGASFDQPRTRQLAPKPPSEKLRRTSS